MCELIHISFLLGRGYVLAESPNTVYSFSRHGVVAARFPSETPDTLYKRSSFVARLPWLALCVRWKLHTGCGWEVGVHRIGYRHHYLFVCLYLRCNWDRGSTVVKVLCYTNRKVAGSIPAGVIGFFIDIKYFRSHYGPGVDSASNRNEYQEYFLGVKEAGA